MVLLVVLCIVSDGISELFFFHILYSIRSLMNNMKLWYPRL